MEFKTTCQKLAKLLIMVGAASNIITLIKADNVVSHSFISTGSTSQPDPLFYRNFWQPNDIPNGKQKNFSITPFYSRSTNSKGLARYFSPFDKDELVVREQGAIVTGGASNLVGTEQDILSYNFNVVTVGGAGGNDGIFNSTLKFSPRQETVGADLVFFAQHCNRFWVSLSTKLAHIKTNMHLEETVLNPSGGSVNVFNGTEFIIEGTRQASNMKEAFKQPQMLYGKIDGSQIKTGLSDITLNFGYNWKRTGNFYAQPFVGLVFPTSERPKAQYMFEPILGNNGHFALFSGIHYGNVLYENSKRTIFVSGTLQTTYRCPNTQKRSFDPVGNPWGRYLTVHDNANDMAAPTYRWGINRFTKDVTVKPYFNHFAQFQLNALHKKFSYHIGYAVEIYNAEEIELAEQWNPVAISDIDAAGGNNSPLRTINSCIDALRVATFAPFYITDLNLNSAAQPFHIKQSLTAAISKEITHKNRDYTLTGSLRITQAQANRALSSWTISAGLHNNF